MLDWNPADQNDLSMTGTEYYFAKGRIYRAGSHFCMKHGNCNFNNDETNCEGGF
jgi:hypothetical protein